ncbi:acetyl-CoA C-acetyltransferase [Jatrophihabitans sp. GAS493]|uniref:thiolase domain-containing protein n=1 Tax=Jatrophihabitans sp. GAS493 TaxID=1907575 RepID=UPI000BB6D7FD|nr:thiolase domain-containing protein [Jatrophihabitans sp. GAS493]SOD74058.1 acetyl-CoA C-acetyltransferase [Jatrophihabitans sp. GAS493]
MAERVAVVGTGQTHHKRARHDLSMPGLVREAAQRALDDAETAWGDIDAVVIGKAPDAFEGVVQPELFLADALGANGKPLLRVHTAGSVGCSAFIAASHLVSSGVFKRVLTVSWEKQSEGNAQWGLSAGRSRGTGAGGYFAPWVRSFIEETGAPEHIGWKVAVKDRLNALKNPYAHLKLAEITEEQVRDSPMLWEPIRFLESCPSSDGAAAAVITDEAGGLRATKPVAWVAGTSVRTELGSFPGRDPVRPQAAVDCARDVYRQAGITDPRTQIDVAELYVPFSWFEPIWLEAFGIAPIGDGWRMVEENATEMSGDFPLNPSGGVLSSNPIGASGMIRVIEAANQVRGCAGDHQIDGARTSIGHAYGGGSQYFAMVAFHSEPM